jgi:hypothetical protein
MRGGAGLSALLRANTSTNDGRPDPGSEPARRLDRGGGPDSYSDDWRDLAPPANGATLARLELPEDTPAVEAAAPSPTPPNERLDIEAIMRELADRLEFEYLRMYGTSGD